MKVRSHFFILTLYLSLLLLFWGCASSYNVKSEGEWGIAVVGDGNQNERPETVADETEKVKLSEFILGIGDTVDISVFRHDELKKSVKIDSTGMMMFPLIGDIKASGKGIYQLRDELMERLAKYVVNPQVSISISSVQSQKVMILGEVNSPSVITLDVDMSVMEAITKAGGMTEDAKMENVLLIRKKKGKPEMVSLNLKKAYKEGDLSSNVTLKSGDIVYLPAVALADTSWFFSHLSKILSPIVSLESGIVLWPQVTDVLEGKASTTSSFTITNQ